MRLLLSIARLILLSSLAASAAGAQRLVEGEGLAAAIWILDKTPSKSRLLCSIQLSSNLQQTYGVLPAGFSKSRRSKIFHSFSSGLRTQRLSATATGVPS